MKNDRFFNGIAIVVPLLVAIGMFKHGLPYFWAPYLFSLLCLCRYSDYLETKEQNSYLESIKYDNVIDNECDECGYIVCVCKPVVNQ